MATDTREMTAVETLGAYVAELRYEDLPDHVVHAARRVLLDTIGAGLGGMTGEEGKRVLAGIQAIDRAPDTTIWGTDARLSVTGAALVNGTLAHALEMDDFGGCSHSGTVVIPAALSLVERDRKVDGRTLLTAIVAGYEIARRALQGAGGYRAHTQLGWHSTGTCGGFGAAAAGAYLMELDSRQTAWALGLAGTYTGGTWAFLEDGAMSKRLHPGKAAANGISAAVLAAEGFTGPTRVFEAEWGGFLSTYASDEADVSRLTAGLGEDHQILYTGFKPWASCRRAHGGIDALLGMRSEFGIDPGDVERIVVRTSPFYARMVGNANRGTMLDAQMSLPYGLSIAMLTGRADIQQYSPEVRSSADVDDMLARVEVVTDNDKPMEQEPDIAIHLKDGTVRERRVDRPLGAPDNPLTDEALTDKFRSLAALSLPAMQIEELGELIWKIDQVEDVRQLSALLATG